MTHSRNHSFKIVLLGEGAVGKTSLVLRYVENKFNDKHLTTLQVCLILLVILGTFILNNEFFKAGSSVCLIILLQLIISLNWYVTKEISSFTMKYNLCI